MIQPDEHAQVQPDGLWEKRQKKKPSTLESFAVNPTANDARAKFPDQ